MAGIFRFAREMTAVILYYRDYGAKLVTHSQNSPQTVVLLQNNALKM